MPKLKLLIPVKTLLRSRLLRAGATYTVANALGRAVPFLLLPVLTRYLSPADYGIISMFQVLVVFLVPFAGLSVGASIVRTFYNKEAVHFPSYITNCLFILISSSILLAFVIFFFIAPISTAVSVPQEWIWAALFVAVCQFVMNTMLAMWRVQEKSITYGAFQFCRTVTSMGIAVFLIVGFDFAWEGRLIGQVVAFGSFTIVALVLLSKHDLLRPQINTDYQRQALRFGLPLILHSVSGAVVTYTDRLFITNMVGLSATGEYAVGYQIAMIVGLLTTSFNVAYVPWLFEKLSNDGPSTKISIVRLTYAYYALLLLLATGLSIFAPFLLSFLVGKEFARAGTFLAWLAFAQAFRGMYFMVTNYLFFVEKTGTLAYLTLFTALLNVILTYILIQNNGPVGAAQATALTYLIRFLLAWYFGAKYCPMPWFGRRAV